MKLIINNDINLDILNYQIAVLPFVDNKIEKNLNIALDCKQYNIEDLFMLINCRIT